jgi:hypothetical protein
VKEMPQAGKQVNFNFEFDIRTITQMLQAIQREPLTGTELLETLNIPKNGQNTTLSWWIGRCGYASRDRGKKYKLTLLGMAILESREKTVRNELIYYGLAQTLPTKTMINEYFFPRLEKEVQFRATVSEIGDALYNLHSSHYSGIKSQAQSFCRALEELGIISRIYGTSETTYRLTWYEPTEKAFLFALYETCKRLGSSVRYSISQITQLSDGVRRLFLMEHEFFIKMLRTLNNNGKILLETTAGLDQIALKLNEEDLLAEVSV